MARIAINFPDEALFTCEIPVRITDLNYGSHLAHDTLVSILHEARVRFLKDNGLTEGDIDGLSIYVVDLGVVYRSEVFYGQTLKIEVAIGDQASRSCDLVYRVSDSESGSLVALAKTGIVFFDPEKKRVASVPASWNF